MAGSLGMVAMLMLFFGAMLSFGVKIGMLDKPSLRRCGACGRLRHGGVCPCSDRRL
jgi:hypothetical protein